MGRRKQRVEVDQTVVICQEPDERMEDRWFRAMALLLHPKWDEPLHKAEPLPDELTVRLDMVCGL